ncbi:MAG TPA: tetratricopeptide repeat protein [Luteitalea sp.]|nr:tetratricopeptide repeat protein [Luteitalea sp.]
MSGRSRRLGVTTIVLLALVLAIKLALAVTLASHPLVQPVGELDSGEYWRLAQRVAGGDVLLQGTTFYVSPLYIYWLALAQLLTGASVVGVLALQAVAGTLAVWIAALTARALVAPANDEAGRDSDGPQWRAGLVAGGALALTGIVALQEAVILQSALDALLMALFAWTATRAFRGGTDASREVWSVAPTRTGLGNWAWCGVALALLAANRPNAWILGSVVAVAAVSERATTRLRAAAALVVGVSLVLAPFAVRTAIVEGQWQVLPGHGGLNFYIGNHASATGTYTVIEGITPSIEGQVSDAQTVASLAEGRTVPLTQVSAHFVRRALAWWRDAPVAASRLFLYKLWLSTHAWELPVNLSYAWFREQVTLLGLLPVGAWLLVPVGLAGSIAGHLVLGTFKPVAVELQFDDPARRQAAWRWFRWLLPAYLVSVAMFFVVDRYRAPALVLGAIHLGVLASMRRPAVALASRRTATAAAVVAVVVMAAGFIPLPFQLGQGDADAQMAVFAVADGRDEEAERWLARASASHPAPGIASFRAGLGWQSRNEIARAERAFREAHRLDPDVSDTTFALASVLLQQGKGAEALPLLTQLEGAARTNNAPRPWEQGIRLDVALAHWQAGDEHLAREALRGRLPAAGLPLLRARALAAGEARKVDVADWLLEEYRRYVPGDAEVTEKLGLMRAQLGDVPTAASLLEEAARLDPARATARFNLAIIRARQGRRDDAVALLREALRIDPTYAQAAGALREILGTP